MRKSKVGAAVLAVLSSAACGTEVRVKGAAPSGQKVAISIPEAGVVEPAHWPNACTLINSKEIKAILPDASRMEKKSNPVVARWGIGGSVGSGRAPQGSCEYSFDLPRNGDHKMRGLGMIFVDIRAVAGEGLLAHYYDKNRKSISASELDAEKYGADACYDSSDSDDIVSIDCRRGSLMFGVSAIFQRIDFKAADEGDPGFNRVVCDQVLTAVAQTIAAKVG